MKRSQINEIIRHADVFMKSFGYHLPHFAYWSPADMKAKRDTISNIVNARLGWDVTDFGDGDFAHKGLFLFTTRNGSLNELKAGGGMCYAEKIMISRKDQITPLHSHIDKTEDIINRGGGVLAIRMFESDKQGQLDRKKNVTVTSDGLFKTLAAGDVLRLAPGESVTLRPGNWHTFWGEDADVLIGEVSGVNDDLNDNIFAEPTGRFSQIEEDEEPLHLLVSDYDNWL